MKSQNCPTEAINPVKRTIRLTDEQIGPYPIATETLWFDIEEGKFRLRNVPCFVDQVSFDDVVSLEAIGDHEWRIDAILQQSGNSTIWLLVEDTQQGEPVIRAIKKLGCAVETGIFDGYYAINVPEEVEMKRFLDLIQTGLEENWIAVDYPSVRHDE